MTSELKCRENCGACCIAPSISSMIPSMSNGKPAGIPCPHLNDSFQCKLFNLPTRPTVCENLKPCIEMCGKNRDQAMLYLCKLERETKP